MHRQPIPTSKARFLAASVILIPPAAFATLVSDSVTCSAVSTTPPPIVCSAPSATVGAAVEFSIDAPDPGIFVDILASSIQLTGGTRTTWFTGDGFTIGDLDWTTNPAATLIAVGISGVNLEDGVFDMSKISFTSNSITFDIGNTIWNSSSTATIELTFGVNAIPEPSALSLAALAILCLAMCRRPNASS